MSSQSMQKAIEIFPAEARTSVIQTFRGMIGIEPVCVESAAAAAITVQNDVSGVIQIQDEAFHVTFVLGFPEETICYVMEKVLRKPFTELNRSAQQGVGEFSNMIYGALKSRVNPLGFSLAMAIPSVVLGSGHTVEPNSGEKAASSQILKFQLDGRPFHLVLSFFPGKS